MGHQDRKPDGFPEGWTDPLELYGDRLTDIRALGFDLDHERESTQELIDMFGAKWVWAERDRLFSVARCLKDYPGKVKG